MTLRAQLTAAFLAVVLGPLLLGAILVGRAVPRVESQRSVATLTASRQTVALALSDLCHLSERSAEALALRAGQQAAGTAGHATPQSIVASLVRGKAADVAALQNAQGQITASAGALPSGGADLPAGGRCALVAGHGSAVLMSSVELQHPSGAAAGRAWVGFAIDKTLAEQLAGKGDPSGHQSDAASAANQTPGGINVTFVAHGRPLASTLHSGLAQKVISKQSFSDQPQQLSGSNWMVAGQRATRGTPVGFVVSERHASSNKLFMVLGAILLVALLAGIAVAFRLAHAITAPLGAMGEAAERVAEGDLDTRVPFRRRDEIGRLAESFNTMTSELRSYVDALRASRDQLRRNLNLLGDTLSSTHDLNRILTVILDTAVTASGAQAGAIFLTGPTDLQCKASRGFDATTEQRLRALRVHPGEGIVGRVAETGEPLLGRRSDSGIEPLTPEPYASTYVAVPFKSTGRLLGVLVLTDRLGSDDFDDSDLSTLRSFASQAAVAVENVLLHEEAQRLSLTDGLTGLWNYRYFQMNFAKEIERASRFNRPLALLMLDIDRFKDVNDTHGHQRGDAVLVELARRISGEIREVDLLARYGGEEIVLVLPETDEVGAQRTAERICDVVRSTSVGVPGTRGIPITVSVGIAVFPQHGATVSSLVERADDALYAAKSAGRDTWRMAEPNGYVPV